MILQNNGGDDLATGANGAFVFKIAAGGGSAYSITVASQPSNPVQTCTVTNGAGMVAAANVSNAVVACITQYTVGGTASDVSGTGLVLQLSGGSDLSVPSSGAFTFSPYLSSGTGFTVTVKTQPSQQTCTVRNGTGTVPVNASVAVAISCVLNTYSIGGSITGLTGNGLVLLNNGADPTSVNAGAAQFTMNAPVTSGDTYSVTIETQPVGETCAVTNAAGTDVLANVANATLSCTHWSTASVSTLYSFTGGSDGSNPSVLLQGIDGNFYGVNGGTSGSTGIVYKVSPVGAETTLYTFLGSFSPPLPQGPNGLVQGSDGNLYGTTFAGGSANYGAFFKIDAAGTFSALHSFTGGSDGSVPSGLLLQGSDGNFFGISRLGGGPNNNGAIFRIDAAGGESVLFSMPPTGVNAGYPSFLQAGDDAFYYASASPGGGTISAVTPTGAGTAIYNFTGGSDGSLVVGMVEAPDGNLFGVTGYGGLAGFGTAFKLTRSGTLTTLHTFGYGTDGSIPNSLILGNDGNFYGTTTAGGATTYGTLFRLTPAGDVTVLYSFANGAQPTSLIQASDGNFYCLSRAGGADGLGAIFKAVPQ
ncbi:MAG TPA: choice-of-anchor tandem repeat GloVer-containing protein [Steroidobacteraceae bacterium]